MDLFEAKNVSPMLIAEEASPFDDPAWRYELKLDGERAIAYLGPEGTELRNKRNRRMLPVLPELDTLHRQVKNRVILDGEYIVLKNGKPDFYEIQRRSLMSNPLRIDLAAKRYPASFVAYDLLYLGGKDTTSLPLEERQALLRRHVSDAERMSVSRVFDEGVKLFELTKAQGLEGIVAKRLGSKYYMGKRTKDWIKCKNLLDDDFVVCGYIPKENNMTSVVLGQFRAGELMYKGHVTLGVGGDSFRRIRALPRVDHPPFAVPSGNDNAVWVAPELVCVVKYMMKTRSGGMRQPVFKGLRDDKQPEECMEH